MHMKKTTLRQQNYRLRKLVQRDLNVLKRLILVFGEKATLNQTYKETFETLISLDITKGELNVRKKR